MEIKPIGDRILVEVEKQKQETTIGGLIIPTQERKQQHKQGKIVALPETKIVNDLFKIGDEVIFLKHSGSQIVNEGKTMVLIHYKEILSTVE